VPGRNDPREPDFEQANSQLNEGLESCRAVVKNYRAMLAGDQGGGHGEGGDIDPGAPPGKSDSEDGEDKSDQPEARGTSA
jgi:hypothetical protein